MSKINGQGRLIRALGAVCAGACLVSAAHAGGIRVGVIGGGTMTHADAAAQLNDNTWFTFNASAIGAGDADTLAELMQYDVVVLGDSGNRNNGYTEQMFAALRQYLDAGGGIVTVGWYNFATDVYTGQQALDADYITPFADAGYQFTSGNPTINILGSHAITDGINSFQISPNLTERAGALDANATLLGSVDGVADSVAIAYQDQLAGRSVYLGGLYLAQSSYGVDGLRSGVEDRLFEQAVAWAAIPSPGALALLAVASLAGQGRRRRQAS